MALIPCKICKNEVFIDALICPKCGAPKPGVSYEEENLEKEISHWRNLEKEYEKQYRTYMSRFFWVFRFKKERNKFVDLANVAQQKVAELTKQLNDLRMKKRHLK